MAGRVIKQPLLGRDLSEGSIQQYGAADSDYQRPALRELYSREFYQREGWFEGFCETLFKIKARNTTIRAELYNGVIHFISCLYCLAVVPQQLSVAGYGSNNTVVSVALCVGVGTICCGIFSNLPFVLAPPTAVTIFQAVYLKQYGLGPQVGNIAVVASGLLLMLMGWRPLGQLVKRLIPVPIQVGTVVGVGLLTTLAGSTEVKFVITGQFKILRMGDISPEVVITFLGVLIICVTLRYHVKGSFCIAVIASAILWWIYNKSFPDDVFGLPAITTATLRASASDTRHLAVLTADLVFLYVLYLNGLITSLANLAVLTREDGATPRGRWVFILSGLFTIGAGLLTSAPILVSPESCAAIKEGAKTGLSAVVCGVLFLFAVFLGPLFEHIPPAGTSPVLIMIGLVLFQNVGRIDWRNVADAAPAFVVLFYIPFTYSIIEGTPHHNNRCSICVRCVLTMLLCTAVQELFSATSCSY
jgi:AGZA family xanthine/uracil permease-like MFS transporter